MILFGLGTSLKVQRECFEAASTAVSLSPFRIKEAGWAQAFDLI